MESTIKRPFSEEELANLNRYRAGRLFGNGCGLLFFGGFLYIILLVTTGMVNTIITIIMVLVVVGLVIDYMIIWDKGTKDFEAGYAIHVFGKISEIKFGYRQSCILVIENKPLYFGRYSTQFAKVWTVGDTIDVSQGAASGRLLSWKKIEEDGSVIYSSAAEMEMMNQKALVQSKWLMNTLNKLGPHDNRLIH